MLRLHEMTDNNFRFIYFFRFHIEIPVFIEIYINLLKVYYLIFYVNISSKLNAKKRKEGSFLFETLKNPGRVLFWINFYLKIIFNIFYISGLFV
jgi:hypothetical protein